jgi:restriction system protein
MLPLLSKVADGKEHSFKDLVEELATQFKLTEGERKQLLPSGGTFTFSSRVSWARTYMKKAGLLEQPKRGIVVISERGKNLLLGGPKTINVKSLEQFPEFIAFRDAQKVETHEVRLIGRAATPEEVLEGTYRSLNTQLANDLLEVVKGCTPAFFEKLWWPC